MTSKKTTDLAVPAFTLVPYEPSDFLMPGEKLSPADLYRFKVPSGASGAFWELPDGQPSKAITAVILHASRTRTFWVTSIEDGGGDSPPDCSSNDAVFGHGLYGTMVGDDGVPVVSNANPSGKCESCPMAAYGSGKGDAQACREGVRMLLMLDGDPMPAVLNLPPGSLNSFKNYRMRILRPLGVNVQQTTTHITLMPAKSKTGIAYFEVHFELGDRLSDEATATVEGMRSMFPQ